MEEAEKKSARAVASCVRETKTIIEDWLRLAIRQDSALDPVLTAGLLAAVVLVLDEAAQVIYRLSGAGVVEYAETSNPMSISSAPPRRRRQRRKTRAR